MLEIFIFLQKLVKLESKNQHTVITNANTSNGIKISTFFSGGGGSQGMMLYLSNANLRLPGYFPAQLA